MSGYICTEEYCNDWIKECIPYSYGLCKGAAHKPETDEASESALHESCMPCNYRKHGACAGNETGKCPEWLCPQFLSV